MTEMADNTTLYLSAADVEALGVDPTTAREAVARAFREHAAGGARSKPKLALELGPGHAFQAMCAVSAELGLAGVKWLGMAPSGGGGAGIHAVIALNDLASGRLLAILDGDVLTGLRTAAMSALAAEHLARPDSETIGFVGCGLQARTHLAALTALLPKLSRVLVVGRGRDGAARFADHARDLGFAAERCDEASDLLERSDVVVTTVPMSPGFRPFLDPGRLRPGSFVAAVDVGRSWVAADLRRLDILAVDDHRQQAENAPISDTLGALGSFDADLSELACGAQPGRTGAEQRAMFIFRGFALADLAVAALAFRAAVARGIGRTLPR